MSAERFLGADLALARLIAAHGPCALRRRRVADPFAALTRSIVAQRISSKAAKTVYARLEQALGGPPTPALVLQRRATTLRAAGLPQAKVDALRELARRVRDEELPLARMGRWSDARVEAALSEIKGVGRWTAQIFCIFHLARPDVFPDGDLGVLEGLRRLDGLAARPRPAQARARAEAWAPYRSTAAWYLWRSLDGPAQV
ncbi:MAG: DNA-3-methyladenine glycosylase [Planctomycetota bacterium]